MAEDQINFSWLKEQGSFQINLLFDDAFKLFTAIGEKLWVPGWEPQVLGPLPQEVGTVFLTGKGLDYTIWTVIESESVSGRLRYSRVTPGSRAGIVSVKVTSIEGGSRVDVAYDLTAISPDGEASLQAYSALNFSKMMEEWRSLIEAMSRNSRSMLANLVA